LDLELKYKSEQHNIVKCYKTIKIGFGKIIMKDVLYLKIIGYDIIEVFLW